MNEHRHPYEQPAKRRRANGDENNDNDATMEMLEGNDEVYVTIDLTWQDDSGNTALHLIFKRYEEPEVVQILEVLGDQRVDFNVANAKNETPLHLAVAKRMRRAIELLIARGAEVARRDEAGNSISHYFIEDEYDKFLAISNLDDLNCGLNERHLVERDSADFVDWLTTMGFDFAAGNYYGWSPLHMAIERNLQHLLPTILRRASSRLVDLVDEKNRNLLHLFVQINDKYRRGGTFGAPLQGVWSVGYARRYAVEIVRILLESGVSVDAADASGDTPLHLAVRNKEDRDVVRALLDRFSVVQRRNNFGDTVFHEAIRCASSKFSSKASYYLEISRCLLAKGSDPDSHDRYGVAPVYYTVSEKKLPAIQLMREYRADFAYVTKSEQNLLHLLAFKHDNDKRSDRSWETMFELLVDDEPRLDIGKADKLGQTPLHLAVKHNNVAIASKLLARGADVNVKSPDGARPLDRVNCHRLLGLLLRHGAHVNARDNHGATALSHALAIKSAANVAELLRHGADINEPFFLDLFALLLHDPDGNCAVGAIVRHWLKLKAADIDCSREYDALLAPDDDPDLRQFYRECRREIAALRCTYVDNDSVSLYRWLRMSPSDRASRVDATRLKAIVACDKLPEQFPKYHVLVLGYYREAVARSRIARPAIEAWRRRVTAVNWPSACVERIISRLGNADLLSIAEV